MTMFSRAVPRICGFYYIARNTPDRIYLPLVKLKAHATVHSNIARTTLTQTFINPSESDKIDELRYTFPLYDGVSVVGFTCTVGDRVIKGIVKERAKAREAYEKAAKESKTAGLLEQLPKASDVFTTTVSNVPPNSTLVVDVTYLGELKHDAEVDGIRYTIPTSVAPRYGDYGTALPNIDNIAGSNMEIVVDVDMPNGCPIETLQSPSHPISVHVGATSRDPDGELSLQKGHVTLTHNQTELASDFIVQIVAQNIGNPTAILEEHAALPGHRALMATLVPKFNLPYSRPEIVFICDRSGSMMKGNRIPNVQSALRIFLKSLPVGVKFNICSFGSNYSFLWDRSRNYDKNGLEEAMRYVDTFDSNFGGTEMKKPLEEVFKRRYKDMNLEAFLLTDGEIWSQNELFAMLNTEIEASKGAIRVFTLGIGDDVSHALIEGVARAGNGFSQAVADYEKLDGKVVRMLKASLTPHVNDYSLEVKYGPDGPAKEASDDGGFEIIEKVQDTQVVRSKESEEKDTTTTKEPISLFDTSANPDAPINSTNANEYLSLPAIEEPKMLQTPYNIPPLFPFSRTNVYILMSDAAPSQMPKSAILRGTCEHGPLKLEIPVTVLAEKGETVHQLAARKAVQELEEHRGWIYDAKDADGTLLKTKYDGRFADMVEREAVRLGVKFQVGGKWCSFVALGEEEERQEPDERTLDDTHRPFNSQDILLLDGPPITPAPRRCRRYRDRKANMLSKPSTHYSMSMPKQEEEEDSDEDMAFGLFDDPSLSPPPPIGYAFGQSVAPPAAAGTGARRPFADIRCVDTQSVDTNSVFASTATPCSAPSRPGGSAPFGSTVAPPPRTPTSVRHPLELLKDPLEFLINSQTFEGFWVDTDALWDNLGVTKAKAVTVLPPSVAGATDIVATLAVIAFFEKKLKGDKDSWELMVQKAEMWVEAQDAWKTVGKSAGEVARDEKVIGIF